MEGQIASRLSGGENEIDECLHIGPLENESSQSESIWVALATYVSDKIPYCRWRVSMGDTEKQHSCVSFPQAAEHVSGVCPEESAITRTPLPVGA